MQEKERKKRNPVTVFSFLLPQHSAAVLENHFPLPQPCLSLSISLYLSLSLLSFPYTYPHAHAHLQTLTMENEENTGGDEGEAYSWMDLPLSNGARGDKKRRFSEDQIKSLESMFQTQTKLEPRQKLQLAKELNLEPRQVAIWFQNKRARWKSKQLEREYSSLKADYDFLLSSFESLKQEKQVLLNQLQVLAEKLEKQGGEPSKSYGNSETASGDKVTIGNDLYKHPLAMCSEDEVKKQVCFSEEEQDVYMGQMAPATGNLTSGEELQFSLQASWPPSDQLRTGTQQQSPWWDFWPLKE